ncbi:hypothetical protein LCI18_000358 [Fusarium solani-melongenae]|uniref:Uncharacterized protein n=1 Tax=Fusarium solani subsp. cucurbitae TaxID=2747967 RepID=A0ACD3YKM1_FUSSC|nr:hypothetical protein LCI18_000358 [Fusarium solani-melongenae]
MATDANNSQNTSDLPSEVQPSNKPRILIQVAPPVSLPQTLTAYCDPEEVSSKFYLGDSSNRKMFAVTSHGGLTGDRGSIKVYNGPSTDDPLLLSTVPLDESRTRRTLQSEYNPEACPPNLPFRWRKTPKAQVSDRRYPYEWRLYPEQTRESSDTGEESTLSSDPAAANEEAEPMAIVSWKRLGHKPDPFKFQFLVPERGFYFWRPKALLSGLALWHHDMTIIA